MIRSMVKTSNKKNTEQIKEEQLTSFQQDECAPYCQLEDYFEGRCSLCQLLLQSV